MSKNVSKNMSKKVEKRFESMYYRLNDEIFWIFVDTSHNTIVLSNEKYIKSQLLLIQIQCVV